MKIAILEVFEKMQHRYCRFHVTHTWKHELDKLYMTHKGLKPELESLINYPLGPSGFEIAWNELVDRYSLHDHPAIISLWKKWKMWVMAYFKGLYYRRMTSTQCFVNSVTSLQQFAEKMLEALQHMNHIEAGESHYSQVLRISDISGSKCCNMCC
jgi:hypothetical protein